MGNFGNGQMTAEEISTFLLTCENADIVKLAETSSTVLTDPTRIAWRRGAIENVNNIPVGTIVSNGHFHLLFTSMCVC